MNKRGIKSSFARIGARIDIDPPNGWNRFDWGFDLDVAADKRGERFQLRISSNLAGEVDVPDVRPDARHLLLDVGGSKFLCGHDERHWFVAAIPPRPEASDVPGAMEALKPQIVLEAQDAAGLTADERMLRKNAAYVRQGEWFFVPRPDVGADASEVRRNEPISRGNGSKPHIVEAALTHGGERVFVSHVAPAGFTADELAAWSSKNPTRRVAWEERRRGARVLARGRVRHPDHATIMLDTWHEVAMNRENEAPAMRHVVFLD